ncbi:MAG TPA: DMT family transporter [Candidatus Limnocylindrales bacterium]|nr:DMT family transporter [Candidatus Limnocylindrales bacterium]
MRIDTSTPGAPSRLTIGVSITLLMAVWAINFLVVKIGLHYLPALAFASFRVVAAGLFMLLVAPICTRLPLFSPPDNGSLTTGHALSDFWTFAYLGFFGVAVNQLCFTLGLNYTSVTHSSIIVGMAPIYTLTLAVLFGLEQLSLRKALGMAVAFSGVAILASSAGMSHHSPTLLGDAITMCGSLGFAMYVVFGKRVAASYNPLTITTWNFVFGALIALPLALQQFVSLDLLHRWRAVPWQLYACVVYTALFSSTLAYLFYFWLLRYLEASQLASFSYLLPVSAFGLGILFLGERGSWFELLGGALALLGVYAIESTRRSP